MNRLKPEPPRGVLRRAPPNDRGSHQRYLPSPGLAATIEHFWVVTWDLRGEPGREVATLSHPSVHVTFEGDRAEVIGVPTERFTRVLEGQGRVVGIKFRPAMFHALLRAPVSTLTDRRAPLNAVLGPAWAPLAQETLADADAERCVQRADDFLLAHLPRPDPKALEVAGWVARLVADRALVRAEQVAALAGLELRQLQRVFKKYVGVGPKWVLQRYRLHEAAALIASDPGLDMAQLSLALGYFDQAHFIRDFKQLVGLSPGEYARQ
jgi:AraC-like DNA-binding protein